MQIRWNKRLKNTSTIMEVMAMKKFIPYLCLFMILIMLSGCASQTTVVANTVFEQDSHDVIAQVSLQVPIGDIYDIYVPLTIPDLVQSGQTLIEFTLVEVLSTSIEGAPQGWVGNNHNQFLLRVDNVLLDGSWVRVPYVGEKFTILSHHDTEYFEGQRYLTFVHFDIINNQKDGVPLGMTPYSLDNRVTAIVNEDRTITAMGFFGFYLREFDGYTIEQMMERIQGYQVPIVTAPPIPPSPPGWSVASRWASAHITRAHSLGLIPHSLFAASPTFTDYTIPATRAEFAALAVAFHGTGILFEIEGGVGIPGRMEFNDTDDINVQIMGYLGVVSGVGGGYFNPYGEITREQAAVMLTRLAESVGHPLPLWQRGLHPSTVIADYDDISSWAVQSVAQIYQAGIMSGVGDRRFAPQSTFTREQSIVTILRLFDMVNTELPNALENVDTLNYSEFLRLLEANGFVFESRNFYVFDVPTHRRAIYIGDERLVVYCGTLFANYFGPPSVQITWVNEVRWPSRDSVSVIYSGDDDRIIEFLNATFGYNPARQG